MSYLSSKKKQQIDIIWQIQWSAWFLAVRFSGAGRRTCWVRLSGEGWVFMCLELQCDRVSPTPGGGEKTEDPTRRSHCVSDSLLAFGLKTPPAKNRALHCSRFRYSTAPPKHSFATLCHNKISNEEKFLL